MNNNNLNNNLNNLNNNNNMNNNINNNNNNLNININSNYLNNQQSHQTRIQNQMSNHSYQQRGGNQPIAAGDIPSLHILTSSPVDHILWRIFFISLHLFIFLYI